MDKLIRLNNGSSILLSEIGSVSTYTYAGSNVTIRSRTKDVKEGYAVTARFNTEEDMQKFVDDLNGDIEDYLAS